MNVKIKWLRDQLLGMKLDGMIITNPINVQYLTGLSEEGILILAPKENIFVTDSRYIESVNKKLTIADEIVAYDSRNLDKYDYENIFLLCENVGFEENYVTYETYKKYMQMYQVNFVETEGLIENQRIVKENDEIEKIKKACEITDKAFEYIIRNIKEDMTEKEVAFEIQKFMIQNGADGLAFDSIVAFGENSSMPHAVPTDRKIKVGDIIQFDIGAKYNGYCSDLSRVVFVEEMKEEYKKVYDFVFEQQKKVAEMFKEGVNIKTIIKDRETDYKLRNYDVMHAFGHGVGLEIHETPSLHSRKDNILKANSIVTIEPGVYKQGKFGIRIEDTFQINKNNCESLTKCKKDYTVIKLLKNNQ